MTDASNAQRLTVFVGSSSEAAVFYDHVCGTLEEQGHDVQGWKTSFEKGEGFLDSLRRIADSADAALLIATPDDILHYRGETKHVLRDNVLFEAGLFTGVVGPLATGIVVAGDKPVGLPTDLSGISTFSFRPEQRNAFSRDVRNWASKILSTRSQSRIARRISTRIQRITSSSLSATHSLLLPRIEHLLTQASRGIIELTPEQYFERIRYEIEKATVGTNVLAVASSLSAVRWSNDPVQNRYIAENFLARERGADIRRLFLFDNSVVNAAQARSIHNHISRGIPARCISIASLSVPIEDMVLFESNDHGPRAYKAYLDNTFKEKVVNAQMLIDHDHCADIRRRFNEIWRLAWEPNAVGDSVEVPGMLISPPARHEFAPGLEMTPRWTTVEVITCRQASKARGHELHRELKSLVVTTSKGPCVVHVPGDCVVSLRKVKQQLRIDEAYIADPEELLELDLGPGTVCAVLDPVWSMRHLVDQSVFEISEVVTNNGTRTGYFTFDPDILRSARQVVIGDFLR